MTFKRGFYKGCRQISTTLLLLVMIMACSHDKKPGENLQQAFKIHQDAIKIRNEVADRLDRLSANEDSLFVTAYKENLDSISNALENWDEQLVEVPGFEESHDHAGHDHDHDHAKQPELTPGQHLQVQQHLLQEIRKIEKSINRIKEQP